MLYFRVELPRSSVFGRLSKIKRVPSSILIIAVKHLFVIDFSSLPYHLVVLEGSCRKKREREKKKEEEEKRKSIYTRESATSATTTGHYQRRQNSSGHRTEDKDDGHEARRGRHVVERDDVCR